VLGGVLLAASLVEVLRVAAWVIMKIPGAAVRLLARPEAVAFCSDPRRRRSEQRRRGRLQVRVSVAVGVCFCATGSCGWTGGAAEPAGVCGNGGDLDVEMVE
jgi:hypothetical protein